MNAMFTDHGHSKGLVDNANMPGSFDMVERNTGTPGHECRIRVRSRKPESRKQVCMRDVPVPCPWNPFVI